MNNKILISAVAIIVIASGIYFFTREKNEAVDSIKDAEKTIMVKADEVVNEPTLETAAPMPKIKEFNVTARRFVFEPDTIRVKQGDAVKLNITSVDVTHGFSISEFGVNADLKPNQKTTVEFIASKSGEYTFSCSVVCGAGHPNMKGTLIIE